MEWKQVQGRIHFDVFQLMSNDKIRKYVLFYPASTSNPYCIRLHVRHCISQASQTIIEQIVLDFPQNYPQKPPRITIVRKNEIETKIPDIITQISKIDEGNWNKQTSLSQILCTLLQNLDIYWKSYYNFGRNIQYLKQHPGSKSRPKKSQIKFQQVTDFRINKFHQQKALILRFEEIAEDLVIQNKLQAGYCCLEVIRSSKIGGLSPNQAILKLLTVKDFKDELKKQLINGRWINKILRCNAGLRSKKQLIKFTNQLATQVLGSQARSQEQGTNTQQSNCL